MPVTEEQAFQILSLANQTEGEQRERALRALADYRDSRKGEPLFPTYQRAAQEKEAQMRGYFQDRERHGLDRDTLGELQAGFANYEGGKHRFFNIQFLAHRFETTTDHVEHNYEAFRDSYASKIFGEEIQSDSGFYEKVATDFDTEDEIGEAAQSAAMRGLIPAQAFAEIAGPESNLSAKQKEDFRKSFDEIAKATSARLDPYRDTIRQTIADLQEKTGAEEGTGGESQSYAEFAQRILDVPESDRALVLSAIAQAGASGDGKGFFQKMGENFARGVQDLAQGLPATITRNDLMMAKSFIEKGAAVDPKLAETGAGYLVGASEITSIAMDPTGTLGLAGIASEKVTPSEEVKAEALERIETLLDAVDLQAQIRDIAENDIDPAKGEWLVTRGLYAASRSMPYTLAAVIPGGVVANMAALNDQSYHESRRLNPDMTREQAQAIANVSAPFQAALEQVSGKILLGKLPTLNRFFNKAVATKTAAATRFGARLGAATGMELLQENAQDITPHAVQGMVSALSEDVPGVDWENVIGGMGENQLELLFAVLPLSLIGAGVGTFSDYANGKSLLSSPELLRSSGLSESRAAEISETAARGEVEQAQSMLREDFKALKIDQTEIATVRNESVAKLRQEAAERAKATSLLETAGVLPAMRRNKESWSLVFPDGTKSDFASHSEADAARWEAVESSNLNVAQETRDLISQLEQNLETGREIQVEFSPEEMTEQRAIDEELTTEEGMAQRKEIAERSAGQEFAEATASATLNSPDTETRTQAAKILGTNQSQWVDGVQRSTIKLFQGASPLTLVEEKLETDVARMMKEGKGLWLFSALREAESEIGERLMNPETETWLRSGNEQDTRKAYAEIREAYSHLGTSFFVGKSSETLGRDFWKNARKLMFTRVGGLLSATAQFFRAVFRRAARLRKASRDGLLNPELEAELARSLGIGDQQQFEAATEQEAAKLAEEIASDAPFSVIRDDDQNEVREFASSVENELGLRSFSLGLTYSGDLNLMMLAAPKNELGQGKGTKAMERLTEFADKKGYRITLTTGIQDKEFGTTSSTRLKRFYKRFGFVENKGRNKDFSVSGNMYREPIADGSEQRGFSAIAGDFESRISRMFDPWQRSPELRLQLAQDIQRRAIAEARKWEPIAASLRSKTDIEEERKQRQAQILAEKLETLGATLDPLGSEELADARNNPAIAPLLEKRSYTRKDGKKVEYWGGRLESPSAYKQRTGRDKVPDEYDGMGQLPPWMFGGTVRPDEAADELGLSGTDQLWETLHSALSTAAQVSEGVNRAQTALRQAEQEARQESQEWADSQIARATSAQAQRENVVAGLRTLNAMVAALPSEIRGKIGGYVQLAQKASPEAMLKEIAKRAAKMNAEVETYLRKEYREKLEKELAKFPLKKKAGKKVADSKLGAEGHEWMRYANEVARLAPSEVDAKIAGSEKQLSEDLKDDKLRELAAFLGRGSVTQDEAIEIIEEQTRILETVGGMLWGSVQRGETLNHGATAAKLAAAVDLVDSMRTGLRNKWLEEQAKLREKREQDREAAKLAAKSSGSGLERDLKAKAYQKIIEKSRQALLNLLSFEGVARYIFGDSEITERLSDAERKASNQKDDAVFEKSMEVEDFFTALAEGNRFKGQRLRFRMSQKDKSVGGGSNERLLSEMEIIDALMMWRQEDGKRHMIGHLDESGKPNGEWSYDEDWIADAESKLSAEGREVMAFLSDLYAGEYSEINPVYRELHGANLPHNPEYSPISVQPRSQKGQDVDPITGTAVSAGSVTPGWLKTRGTAIAEPNFMDATQKYLAHTKQVQQWIAYAPFIREARAIMADRSVGNSIESAAGKQAVQQLRNWLDALEMGGTRDAAAFMAMNELISSATGRLAAMALIGRVSTILVQSTQMGAALAEMPVGAYVSRLSKLMTGNLAWRDAIRSDYIQRRFKEMPPIVQEAMRGLDSLKPSRIREVTRRLGQTIPGADAVFTAGTYAMVYDYQLSQAQKMGLTGAEAEARARNVAERVTDRIAQPTRQGARSFAEVTQTNPMGRLLWAFSSEPRKNIQVLAMAAIEKNPAKLTRAITYVAVINALGAAVIRNAWRDARDGEDDEWLDERNWSLQSIMLTFFTDWMSGVPVFGDMTKDYIYSLAGEWSPSGTLADGGGQSLASAFRDVTDGDIESDDMLKLAEASLHTAGTFNATAASLKSWITLIRDGARVGENISD